MVWEGAGRADMLPAGILPSPSMILSTWEVWAFGSGGFGLNPYSGTWLDTVLFSTGASCRVSSGPASWASPWALMIGWSALAARSVDPLIQGLRPIPITAWLPFSIALFGIRDPGAIFLIALGAFYPIVINATHGARDLGRNLIRAAQMMGARERDLVLRVVLPNALPAIFAGMRIGRRRVDRGDRGRDGRREVGPRLCALGCLLHRPHGRGHGRHGLDRAGRIPVRPADALVETRVVRWRMAPMSAMKHRTPSR